METCWSLPQTTRLTIKDSRTILLIVKTLTSSGEHRGLPNARTEEEEGLERNERLWFSEAFDPHANQLRKFLERQNSGNLKQRAEVPHIQWHAHEEAMRLLRNDPARALIADDVLVIDTAAAVDVFLP